MKVVLKVFCLAFLLFSFTKADIVQNQKIKNVINVLNGFSTHFEKNTDFSGVQGVLVVPNLTKAGLVASGSVGKGIFIAKNDNGGWSAPFFIDYTALGAGLQAGFTSSDLVVLIKNARMYADLFNGKDTISIGAEVAVVNEGVKKGSSTDFPSLSAYALDRGKSTGVFIGVSVDLARITINNQDTDDYYDRIYQHEDIFDNEVKPSKYTIKLHEVLNKIF